MHELVKRALVGTGGSAVDAATGTPVDALVPQLAEHGSEKRLLLLAGSASVCRVAGRLADTGAELPAPAPDETRPECAAAAVARLAELFDDERKLLPGVLQQLDNAGLRLPASLLPLAMDRGAHNTRLRPLIAPLLGERGRWLAQFNSAWRWVQEHVRTRSINFDAPIADAEPPPDDAEHIWEEGALPARDTVLRQMRAHDPATARKWLEDVWSSERADTRATFMTALRIGLGIGDLEFLEAARSDRAGDVRMLAVQLLAELPGSPLGTRMRERAEAMLSIADGTLQLKPPGKVPDDWKADGIDDTPPHGLGKRAWAAIQVLSMLDPAHWVAHFGQPPAAMVGLAAANTDDAATLCLAFSRAALRFRATDWMAPLLDYYLYDQPPAKWDNLVKLDRLPQELTAAMPAAQAEPKACKLLDVADEDSSYEAALGPVLSSLGSPWGDELSQRFMAHVRADVARKRPGGFLIRLLPVASTALAAVSFDDALSELQPNEQMPDIQRAAWIEELRAFRETIDLRKTILDAIGGARQ